MISLLFGTEAARRFCRVASFFQTAQSRRPPHHRLIAQMPPKAKNAIAPMTSHMMMLFIVHLRFVHRETNFPRRRTLCTFPFPVSVGDTTEIKFRSNHHARHTDRSLPKCRWNCLVPLPPNATITASSSFLFDIIFCPRQPRVFPHPSAPSTHA